MMRMRMIRMMRTIRIMMLRKGMTRIMRRMTSRRRMKMRMNEEEDAEEDDNPGPRLEP